MKFRKCLISIFCFLLSAFSAFSQIKISNLPEATTMGSGDVIPIVTLTGTDYVTKKITRNNLSSSFGLPAQLTLTGAVTGTGTGSIATSFGTGSTLTLTGTGGIQFRTPSGSFDLTPLDNSTLGIRTPGSSTVTAIALTNLPPVTISGSGSETAGANTYQDVTFVGASGIYKLTILGSASTSDDFAIDIHVLRTGIFGDCQGDDGGSGTGYSTANQNLTPAQIVAQLVAVWTNGSSTVTVSGSGAVLTAEWPSVQFDAFGSLFEQSTIGMSANSTLTQPFSPYTYTINLPSATGSTSTVERTFHIPYSSNATLLVKDNNGTTLLGSSYTGDIAARFYTVAGSWKADIKPLGKTYVANIVTDHTLTAFDNNNILLCTQAPTITIPAGLPSGFNCMVMQMDSSAVTFAATGTTLNSYNSATQTAGQNATATIIGIGNETFILGGNVTP